MKPVTFELCLPTVPHLVRDLVRPVVVVVIALDLALVLEMVAEAVVEEKMAVAVAEETEKAEEAAEAVESVRRPPIRQSIVVGARVRVLVRRHVMVIVIALALDLARTHPTTIARAIRNARVTTPRLIDLDLGHTPDLDPR